jgi:hypothetical protein
MLRKGYPALGGEGHVCFLHLSSVYQKARLFVFPFCCHPIMHPYLFSPPAPPPPPFNPVLMSSLLTAYLPPISTICAGVEPHYSRVVLGGYEDGRLASTSCTRNQSRDTTHVAIHYQGLNAEGYNTVGCVNRYIRVVYEEEGQVFSLLWSIV